MIPQRNEILQLLHALGVEAEMRFTVYHGEYNEILLRQLADPSFPPYVLHQVAQLRRGYLISLIDEVIQFVNACKGGRGAVPTERSNANMGITLKRLRERLSVEVEQRLILLTFWERSASSRFAPGSFLSESGRVFVVYCEVSKHIYVSKNECEPGETVHGVFRSLQLADAVYDVYGLTEREESFLAMDSLK